MMIDAREAQILEGTSAKSVQQLLLGFGRVDFAGRKTRHECFELRGIHRVCLNVVGLLTFARSVA